MFGERQHIGIASRVRKRSSTMLEPSICAPPSPCCPRFRGPHPPDRAPCKFPPVAPREPRRPVAVRAPSAIRRAASNPVPNQAPDCEPDESIPVDFAPPLSQRRARALHLHVPATLVLRRSAAFQCQPRLRPPPGFCSSRTRFSISNRFNLRVVVRGRSSCQTS